MSAPTDQRPPMAVLDIDLAAIRHNVALLRERVDRPLIAVVKGDGYGHGIIEVTRAALEAGADGIGVTTIAEARTVRAAGIDAPLVSWLHAPGADFEWALRHDVEVGIGSIEALEEIAALELPARLHLKIDTGLARGGCPPQLWPQLVARAAHLARGGRLRIVGIWSHFACADEPAHPSVGHQLVRLHEAAAVAKAAGLREFALHIANSAATLTAPESWCDAVRPGIALYGLDPMAGEGTRFGLRPAMRASARIMLAKDVPAGTGVSYGHTYVTDRATRLAVVPVGYADGIPRIASNKAPVMIGGKHYRIAGRVCMDQFVVDVGDDPVQAGDEAVLWGDPAYGEPSAQQWAHAAGTIHYEIVSRAGGRFLRRHHDDLRADSDEEGE
ncbi:MAG: alanine racemase [Cumulibacter sp.]